MYTLPMVYIYIYIHIYHTTRSEKPFACQHMSIIEGKRNEHSATMMGKYLAIVQFLYFY